MEDILPSFVALQVLYACGGWLSGRLVSLPGLTLAGEVQNFCGVYVLRKLSDADVKSN